MKPAPVVVRVIAAAVAVFLLAAIGYLMHLLTSPHTTRPETLVDAADVPGRRHSSYGIEPARENALSLASIPWTRSSNSPEPFRIEFGAQPFVDRAGARTPVALALLPTLRARHDLARPTPATVNPAEVPWNRMQTPAQIAALSPVAVAPAYLPSIKARHNPLRPSQAMLQPAEVPWGRLAPVMEVKHLEPAHVPRIAAKHDPAKPVPSRVPAASVPWDRDPEHVRPAHVETARMPSALNPAKPKRERTMK